MTQPVRILRLIARLNVGGPAIHVTLLTQKLGAPHYESVLVCGSIEPDEGDMRYYAEQHGVEPVIIPQLGRALNPVRDLITIWKVYRLIRQLKPDIVHTHTAKAGFVGRVAAWLAGVPVIVHTFHGHVFHGYFSWPKTRFFILLERLTARMADTIITLTEGLRRELADEYRIARRSRITVLPLGLDLDVFAQTPRKSGEFRQAWNIPPDAPLIGIIGRLVPVKNHTLFVDAAARVRAHFPDARFAIIGDGETRPEVEAQVNTLGLREAVIFTGWERELALVYSDLDMLVISSLNEGTPVSIIEALAAGCPVVAASVGGVPDVLDHGELGKLVTPGDADALAQGIAETLRQPPDGARAQALMLNRYAIDRLVRDLDSLYRGLLAKKKRTRP
jgi:glycosyltransferase involved in cell wall biosynthesis